MLTIIAVVGFVVCLVGIMIGVAILGPHNMPLPIKYYKLALALCIGGLAAFIALIVVSVASAAENSAPAESAITVKGTSCPTEFDPDDLGWAMVRIEWGEKKIDDNLLTIEHIRVFSYIPDPEKRIWIHIKKIWNPECGAKLFSYGSIGDSDGKRAFAIIRSSGKITAFLLADQEWKRGNHIETFVTNCDRKGCDLTFTLYQNKELVASKTIPIKQFSHFGEPVE